MYRQLEEKTMQNFILLAVLISVFMFSGCPSSNDSYEEENSFLEENVYQEESFEENSDIEEEYHHRENQADIAGDLIF